MVKPLAEFYIIKTGRLAGKVQNTCKECYRERHRSQYVPKDGASDEPRDCLVCGNSFRPRQRTEAFYCSPRCKDQNPKRRASHLLRKYGITVDEYDRMLAEQDGGCAICGQSPETQRARFTTYLVVDHCHDTGRVRGLLCEPCNLLLGRWNDDPALLRRAADYLEAR